ncbi:hypothetical protein DCC79_02900 [bacterium]|nr:MAG: hypothetical protein DCC79_02900 [bacterium]
MPPIRPRLAGATRPGPRSAADRLVGPRGSARIVVLLLGGAAILTGCANPSPTPPPTATALPTATPTASVTPTPTATPFPRDAVAAVDRLNLRAGPDVLHPPLGVVRTATPMAVLGRTADGAWLAVRLPDLTEGWLSTDGVDLRLDPGTIPTQATPSPPPSPTPTPTPTPTAPPMDPALPLVVAPPAIAQGDPVLVRLRAPGAAAVVAAFDGREARLQPVGGDAFAAVLGAGLDMPPGSHELFVTAIDGAGNAVPQSVAVRVEPVRFDARPNAIHLGDEADVLLDPAVNAAENARLDGLWATGLSERLWSGVWRRPVTGTVSSPFGQPRDYNAGALTGRHLGLDLRGGRGTPIQAPARGRVALAEPLTIRGNVVWLDHGWGVFSGYFHLDTIAVSMGQVVEPGTILGAVGATGRVTAPHLHWEVRVQGVPVSPAQWLLRDVGAVP